MKARHLIYLITAVALFVGCKGKSKVAISDANTITVSVEYTQQYCGGAAPNRRNGRTDECVTAIGKSTHLHF